MTTGRTGTAPPTYSVDTAEHAGAVHWFTTDAAGKMVLWDATPFPTHNAAMMFAIGMHTQWEHTGNRAPYGTWA